MSIAISRLIFSVSASIFLLCALHLSLSSLMVSWYSFILTIVSLRDFHRYNIVMPMEMSTMVDTMMIGDMLSIVTHCVSAFDVY